MENINVPSKVPNEIETFVLIHIMLLNDKRYNDIIKFRDILNNNFTILKEYENLKLELANLYSNDRNMYTKSKNEYIQNILNNYRMWLYGILTSFW